jgi:hypothetical protein
VRVRGVRREGRKEENLLMPQCKLQIAGENFFVCFSD